MTDGNQTQSISADPNRTQLGAAPTMDPNKTVMGTAPSLNATVTIKPIQCPVCKAFNPAGVMFCIDCGLIFDRALPDDAFGAPAVQVPRLVDSSGREFPIRPGENVVGRDGDIQAADGRASRRHAQIVSSSGVLEVEDLGSTNGTTVDGEPLAQGEKRSLKGGEKIGIGGIEFVLAMPGEAGANATQIAGSNKTAAIAAPPSLEKPAAFLVGEGREVALKLGENTFGRKAENDVAIPDAYVSGKHGVIDVAEDGVFLTDIGSTNGTMLNDAKLAPNMRTNVTPEDVIRLGSLEFQVRLAPPMP